MQEESIKSESTTLHLRLRPRSVAYTYFIIELIINPDCGVEWSGVEWSRWLGSVLRLWAGVIATEVWRVPAYSASGRCGPAGSGRWTLVFLGRLMAVTWLGDTKPQHTRVMRLRLSLRLDSRLKALTSLSLSSQHNQGLTVTGPVGVCIRVYKGLQ